MTRWTTWIRFCTANLVITAFLGCMLRYKILYPLPFVNQKFLLHAHSHFAFSGWISQLLMVLLVRVLYPARPSKSYRQILVLHLLAAYGMLLSFPFQGYGLFSISFSFLSIVIAFIFAIRYWKDLNKKFIVAGPWFKAALFFHLFSSLGTFALSYMMATHTINQNAYLASIYFYLHFEYNGWFLFAALGLFVNWLAVRNKQLFPLQAFYLLFISCFPAYVLSALWLPIPGWCYVIVILSAITQFAGWVIFTREGFSRFREIQRSGFGNYILLFPFLALSLKFLLQLLSTWKPLGNLAYGFRPVVIGYLHLILLGVITLFILAYLYLEGLTGNKSFYIKSVLLFTAAVVLNEISLFVQGLAAIFSTVFPYLQEVLFGCALLLFTGACCIWLSFFIHPKKYHYV